MTPKLVYFDINGYAESIRYMLHYGGVKFEDVRYSLKDWPNKEVKDSLPYGQLPIYEQNGETINQSIAIARYVASQTGLLPEDPWKQAKLDAAVLNVYDFLKKITPYWTENDAEKKKSLLKEAVEYYFSRFDRELKANNGHFVEKLSWADFILVATATIIIETDSSLSIEKKYPAIATLMSKIFALPGVKEYLASKKSSS